MKKKVQFINTREIVEEFIPRYAKGKTLDIGGGRSKYRNLIAPHVSEYLVSDLYPAPGVDFIEDARALGQRADTYETVLSFQVLEHIDDTQAVVREIYRVLKPGGKTIVTVPFIAAEHGHPSDFHRFTVEGLRWYFEKANFKIIEIGRQGGMWSVLSELLRFRFLDTYKSHGRFKRALVSNIISIFHKLDRRGFMQRPNFYTNVYIIAEK
jgi:SAM-dependent methyltransferase